MENQITILVVDDIPLMRTMLVKYVQTLLKKMLPSRDMEFKILEAPNGRVALEKLQEEPINLIFLDLMMPEMDGLTFLNRKREIEEYEKIPVIICSAVGEDEVIEKARSLGASSYITKPFKLRTLEEQFRQTVNQLIV